MHLYDINLHFSEISLASYNSLHSWTVWGKLLWGLKKKVFEAKFPLIMKEIKSYIWWNPAPSGKNDSYPFSDFSTLILSVPILDFLTWLCYPG